MIEALSNYLNLPRNFVGITLYNTNRLNYYQPIEIPKKNGEVRVLHAVNGRMKTLQKKTYEKLSSEFKPSKFAKGFVKNSSITSHAKIHRNKKLIISFDIKDFFPSITWARVFGMFKSQPFNFPEEWAIYLAQICCLDNNGPIAQGAVTSPYISNMLCRKLDSRLSKLAKKEKLDYSRYADDLTFSTNKFVNVENIKKWVEEIVKDEFFELNHEKTRVLKKHQRQVVTGIIVNEGLNVNRKYIKNIKAIIHNCMKDGLNKHIIKPNVFKDDRNSCSPFYLDDSNRIFSYRSGQLDIKEVRKRFLYHLLGRIQFVGQVAKANEKLNSTHYKNRIKVYKNLLTSFEALSSKEEEDGIIRDLVRRELIRAQNDNLINEVLDMNGDQLEIFIQNQSANDPRFFTRSFESINTNQCKKQVVELLRFPTVNNDVVTSLLADLRDSQENILGKIVHQDQFKKDDFDNSYRKYKAMLSFQIPKSLRDLYDNLYNEVRAEVKTLPSKSDEFKNYPKSLSEKIGDFKRKTRFGANPMDSTDIKERLLDIIEQIKSDPTQKKQTDVILDNLKAKSFYTDVESTLKALKLILRSMYNHTQSAADSKILITSKYDTNDVIIKVTSNKVKEVSGSPNNRNIISHGKIKNAIYQLNGLCDYSIIAKYDGFDDWMMKNMMREDDAEKTSKQTGFTHELRFKSCV